MRSCRGVWAGPVAIMLVGGLISLVPRGNVAKADQKIQTGQRVALVVTTSELPPPAKLAVDDLSANLQRTLQAVVRRSPADITLGDLKETAIIVVGAASDPSLSKLAQQAKIRVPTDDLGEEGARLKSGSVNGKPVLFLFGKTWTGASHAIYSFLEQELGVGFFIDGDRVPSLNQVSLDGIDRKEVPRVPIRSLFYHPTWPHPHEMSCRLWSFEEWQECIDWMRHRRLNVLPLFHDDGGYSWGDVIFEAFPEIEKNDRTLKYFVTDPTWRTNLNRQIIDYARQSGIQIAFNLFYSQVPEFFPEYYPDLEYHPLRMRNVGIKYTQPECKEIMRKYWKGILDTYGLDDSHLYFVCSYKHELPLPPYVDSHNPPTLDTIALLRELDPKAKIFVETWCWKYLQEATDRSTRYEWLDQNAPKEWKNFNEGIPKDIGVAEWDTRTEPQRIPDPTFGGRPHIQLTHTNMESWWPPDFTRRHPEWVSTYFNEAIDNGAEGILSFHIQANTNVLLADLTADVGWKDVQFPEYYRDYARRRFGSAAAGPMAESIAAFADAANMQEETGQSPLRASLDDLSRFLTFPGFGQSAEALLYQSRELGDRRAEWIASRLEAIKPYAALAGRAAQSARSVDPLLRDTPFYKDYMWELDYLAARFVGSEALYRAHLVHESDPAESQRLYEQAMVAFETVKELFRANPRYHMAALRDIEPEIPFTQAFLDDWEFRGNYDIDAYSMHVVYERIPMFEEFLHALRPGAEDPDSTKIDVRPWWKIQKSGVAE